MITSKKLQNINFQQQAELFGSAWRKLSNVSWFKKFILAYGGTSNSNFFHCNLKKKSRNRSKGQAVYSLTEERICQINW